jgi:hypothetical protein
VADALSRRAFLLTSFEAELPICMRMMMILVKSG